MSQPEASSTSALSKATFSIAKAAGVGAGICVLALVATVLFSEGALQQGLLAGLVAGAISGALGLVLLQNTHGKGMQAAMAAMVGGMLSRMILVGAGLFVTIRGLNAEPLGFAASFFILFAVFATLEWRVVSTANQSKVAS